jgi:hypothetical protein
LDFDFGASLILIALSQFPFLPLPELLVLFCFFETFSIMSSFYGVTDLFAVLNHYILPSVTAPFTVRNCTFARPFLFVTPFVTIMTDQNDDETLPISPVKGANETENATRTRADAKAAAITAARKIQNDIKESTLTSLRISNLVEKPVKRGLNFREGSKTRLSTWVSVLFLQFTCLY